jgi:hypothetical protein
MHGHKKTYYLEGKVCVTNLNYPNYSQKIQASTLIVIPTVFFCIIITCPGQVYLSIIQSVHQSVRQSVNQSNTYARPAISQNPRPSKHRPCTQDPCVDSTNGVLFGHAQAEARCRVVHSNGTLTDDPILEKPERSKLSYLSDGTRRNTRVKAIPPFVVAVT